MQYRAETMSFGTIFMYFMNESDGKICGGLLTAINQD